MVAVVFSTLTSQLFAIILVVGPIYFIGAMAKVVSDEGLEYVRACDGGSDDVTNQCIGRIPEDIGNDTGNPGCAYHEAEIKCIGLCGNTMTWKKAYGNALHRYRIVCAAYIADRIAEKSGIDGISNASKKGKPKHNPAPDDDTEEGSNAEDDLDRDEEKKDTGNRKEHQSESNKPRQTSKNTYMHTQISQSTFSKSNSRNMTAAPSKHLTSEQETSKIKPTYKIKNGSTAEVTDEASSSKHSTIKLRTVYKTKHYAISPNKKHIQKKNDNASSRNIMMLPTMDPELDGSMTKQQWSTICALWILVSSIALF